MFPSRPSRLPDAVRRAVSVVAEVEGGLLDRLRSSLAGSLSTLGRYAAKVLPVPTGWTVLGLLFALLAFLFYAGARPLLGGAMLALSGFFDIVDGGVARATGRTSQLGAFLDSNLDRVSEVAVYLGIALGALASPALVLLALSLSLMVSYARAKGDALGVSLAGVGVGERSERLVVLIVFSILHLVAIGVLIVLVLALITFVQRAVFVGRELARRSRPGSGQTA